MDDPVQCLSKFFYCLDNNRWDELLALTLPDMAWNRMGATLRGHEQIKPMLEARPLTARVCHLLSSAFVDATTGELAAGRVTVRAYLTAYRFDDGKSAPQGSVPMTGAPKVGQVDAVFVRTPTGWMMQAQTMSALFNF